MKGKVTEMAHRISNNEIAFKGATPWHGLGVNVPANATGEEMLIAAKLNWKVQRRAIAMRDSLGNQDHMLTSPLDNFKAIVREDTDQVFQIATKKYQPLQNSEIVDFFQEYCNAGHAALETIGGIDGGAKVWALASLNGKTAANLAGVDQLKGYMLLATSHDGSLQTVGKPTQVRVVCWNTLSMALGMESGRLGTKGSNEFRMKHSKKWTPEVAKEAQQVMGMAIESVQAMNATAETLSKISIDGAGRMEFVRRLIGGESILEQVTANSDLQTAGGSLLDQVVATQLSRKTVAESKDEVNRVGKAILAAMLNSPGSDLVTAKNTMWGAVNGVTYYVDHEKSRTQDTRLGGAWFGMGDAMKQQAVKIALDMAGAR